jgi:tetratricopeptide (TPR) repeat protein
MLDAAYAEAEREFLDALTAFRSIGDRWGTIVALTQLAWLAGHQGDGERGIARADEALAVAEQLGATENVAELLTERGKCRLLVGDPVAARADYGRALELARRTGARELLGEAHLGLAESARALGDHNAARAGCELAISDALRGWYSGDDIRMRALIVLGRIAEAEGAEAQGARGEDALAAARAHYREAGAFVTRIKNLMLVAHVAEALAALALLDAAPERAAELLGLARSLYGPGVPASADALRTEAAARAALGDAVYVRAYARHTALAVTEARGVLGGYC